MTPSASQRQPNRTPARPGSSIGRPGIRSTPSTAPSPWRAPTCHRCTRSHRRNAGGSSPRTSSTGVRSHAASPTAAHPKSMTPDNRSPVIKKLEPVTSPCTHTSGPDHTEADRCLPHHERASCIDLVGEEVDGSARLLVPGRDGPTAVETVATSRYAVGRHAPERDEERGEVFGEPVIVHDADDRRRFTVDPAVDRPGCGEAASGPSLRERLRNRERKVWCEYREPAVLLVDLRDVHLAARQPDGLVVPEPKRRVVPSRRAQPAGSQGPPTPGNCSAIRHDTTSTVMSFFCTSPS